MKWIINSLLVCLIFFGLACKDRQSEQGIDYRQVKEDLLEMNKRKADKQSKLLEEYVRDNNWDALKTGTGIYIYRYDTTSAAGMKAKEGQMATVDYAVTLLDGTKCYSTVLEGPESFLIGMDDVESGLHEAIMYMRSGEKAKILLPSHRAHGFTGDQNRIPMDSPIIYNLELISLK